MSAPPPMPGSVPPPGTESSRWSPAAIWHDCECAAYAADLDLWESLARDACGPVLDLGAGTGRVALHLARAGFAVTAVDREPELVAELERRARGEGLAVAAAVADVRRLALPERFALALAPMQLAQILGGPGGRAAMLRSAAGHLGAGGRLGVALLADHDPATSGERPPVPDVVERDGWVYSSQPIEVRAVEGVLEVRRLRQVVSPAGELREEVEATRLEPVSAEVLEREGAEAGLLPAGRREVAATGEHVGSTVVLLERAGQ